MSILSQIKTSVCPAFRPNRLLSWHTVISASDSHSCISFVNPKGVVFIQLDFFQEVIFYTIKWGVFLQKGGKKYPHLTVEAG